MATPKKIEPPVMDPTPVPEEPQLNAVVIIKEIDPEGRILTKVALNGDVTSLEAQTLIEFGLKAWREQVGLSD